MVGSNRYPVPAAEARAELCVANSRFVATAAPAFTVEQARHFIARIKRELPGASHYVSAYLVGHGAAVIAHCHDDGEPPGTAGRPALAVLSGSGLGDVAVVVARTFGGTKLGTGGLVRAYGDAVRSVLAVLPRAERVQMCTVLLSSPYPYYDQVRLAIATHRGRVLREDFAAAATLTVQFAMDDWPHFQSALRELSNGTLDAEIISTEPGAIPA